MQFYSKHTTRLSLLALLAVVSVTFLFPVEARASDTSLQAETAKNIENDELDGENLEIRRVAREALGTAAGTVVVMDARTGRVLTIVNQEWAIRNAFKPCSTIKLVTGIAGYSEHLIAANGNLSKGSYRLGLDEALAYSNNAYFQKVGANLGSEKLISYARELGLGDATGINAEGEHSGRLPYGNENLRIYSHADDFAVTPLQLAVMVSAITNGGKVLVPRIARSRAEKASFRGYLRRTLDLRPPVFERMIPGMIAAADYGTAKVIPDEYKVAGKTGSCISEGTWVGLFASVAPASDPKYSVVVITRGSRARGKYSAAIAGKVYEALRPTYNRRSDARLIAAIPRNEERTTAKSDREVITIPSADRDIGERRSAPAVPTVKKTVSTRPTGTPQDDPESKKPDVKSVEELFPTIVIVGGSPEITRPRVVRN